jgi:hypothetical protein
MATVRYYLVCLLAGLSLQGYPQEETAESSGRGSHGPGKTIINGYISEMVSPQFSNITDQWKVINYVNQRLNFGWTPMNKLSFTAQLRTRHMYNQSALDTAYFNVHDGFVWQDGKQYLASTFDRLNLKYTQEKFEITVGRQRINWGQSFAWNPNDLFNSYSYLDFDYPERPGSDAIRLQYYNSSTSVTEFAGKIDRENKITLAGLHRFNRSGWDIQLLGGLLGSEDAVAGAGFTGNLHSVSLYGESSFFRPVKNFSDTTALAMIDLGCSTTLRNQLGLQFEGLWVSKEMNINSLYSFFEATMDVKKIAFSRINLFGNITYPITPLINGSLALMWFPDTGGISGFYTGPTVDLSLGNNMALTFIAQYFKGTFPDSGNLLLQKQTLLLSFVRMKWNF